MKAVYDEYKENIKDLLSNKIYVFFIILVAILSYGFAITNFAVGVDDLCFERYVTGPYLLSAERWGTPVLYTLLGLIEFTPFWLELIVTLITVVMGIIFTAFLKKEFTGKLKNIHCIIATSILISYPMLHQAFLYQSTNLSVMIGNLALMIIPILIYINYSKNKDIKFYLLFAIILPFFISMYESCCQTYMCMVLIISFIQIYNSKNDKKFVKKIIKYICVSILILAIGLVINSTINEAITTILSKQGILQIDHSSKEIPWLESQNAFDKVKVNIIDKLIADFQKWSYIRNFIILGIISLGITIIRSIREKKYILIPLMLGIIVFNFAINILQVRVLYRINTSWSLTISFFTIFIIISTNKKIIANILSIIFCIIIFFQTKMMNQLFYNDYVRYQREVHYLNNLANDIINECEDNKKPLVYLYKKHDGTHQNQINEDNGWSIINWGAIAFNQTGAEITKFINSLGYNFTIGTNEQQEMAIEDVEESKIKIVENDNIYETDEYILILIDYNI